MFLFKNFIFLFFCPSVYAVNCEAICGYEFSTNFDETQITEHLLKIEDEKARLSDCIEQETNFLKDLKEQLYFHEVTAFQELIELYDIKNERLKNLYNTVKEQQTKEWQSFLDWQDKHHGRYFKGYNEMFDEIAPGLVKNWHEKESDLKRISSLVPKSLEQDPVFNFWNSEREKQVQDFAEQCKSQTENIFKFINRIKFLEKHEEEVIAKI